MIVVTSTPRSPCGVNSNDNDDNGVITTPTRTSKPNSPLKKSHTPPVLHPTSSSSSCPATPPLTPKRRAIFNSFWEKSSSSIREDDASSECSGRDVTTVKQSPKLQPSYLGIYNFAPPSPMITSKPIVGSATASPGSSSDSLHNLTLSPSTPKSILRRKNSLRERRMATLEGGRDRSASLQLPFVPFTDDASLESKSTSGSDSNSNSKSSRQHSNNSNGVHFDPTITVREVIDSSTNSNNPEDSKWFSDSELGSFMQEAVYLCHSSAINAIKSYSLPSVAKAYAAAHEAGIKEPVVSTTLPQYRALFADPVLHATEDDAIVHDGSKKFFKIMSKEVARVLIVDSSPVTLKLFRKHVCSMFPHVHIDMAKSGEEALDFLDLDSDSDGGGGGGDSKVPHVYDIIIAEEHLDLLSNECNDDGEQQSEHKEQEANVVDDKILHKYQALDLLGSELLHLINDMELESAAAAARNAKSTSSEPNQDREQRHDKEECAATTATKSSRSRHSPSRYSSLKIGVSSTLGEDCESLRKGGADLFWGKPPPKPSNGLRNQMLNALLSKRGKSIFICGC
eukprot:CAMPEP_0171334510 /NCGR_PEP_ID=MMETSP0878-20121228/4693_1 /TAXON_ID=67004 /ORGANISM="Thalassiosira weissflogii, Strain CCMP1336" /LENGTH=566 /DNA_ID=CAMNT_0011835607 /DNA_START=388 /DNA_END=2088 /DNA_ORIENTATION=-